MKTSVLFRNLSFCQKKKSTSNDSIGWFSTPANLEKQDGPEIERMYKPQLPGFLLDILGLYRVILDYVRTQNNPQNKK